MNHIWTMVSSKAGAATEILIKAALAAAISFFTGKHGIAFGAFCLLVALDWLSKRFAVCRHYVADQKEIPLGTVPFWSAVKAWNQARGSKYWQSEKMRDKSEKLFTYMKGVGLGALVDILTGAVAGKEVFTNIMLAYFGLIEAESILENLSYAGEKWAKDFLEVLQNAKTKYLGIKGEDKNG